MTETLRPQYLHFGHPTFRNKSFSLFLSLPCARCLFDSTGFVKAEGLLCGGPNSHAYASSLCCSCGAPSSRPSARNRPSPRPRTLTSRRWQTHPCPPPRSSPTMALLPPHLCWGTPTPTLCTWPLLCWPSYAHWRCCSVKPAQVNQSSEHKSGVILSQLCNVSLCHIKALIVCWDIVDDFAYFFPSRRVAQFANYYQ